MPNGVQHLGSQDLDVPAAEIPRYLGMTPRPGHGTRREVLTAYGGVGGAGWGNVGSVPPGSLKRTAFA